MHQQTRFVDNLRPDFVCKLNKSLYGLNQAPRAWFKKLCHAFVALGFISTKSDQSLFVNIILHYSTCVLVYTNDILLSGSSVLFIQQIVNFIETLLVLSNMPLLHALKSPIA